MNAPLHIRRRPVVTLLLVALLALSTLAPSRTARAATLANTILTSQWNPPSPDPSGITFWPKHDLLVVVDGEVEEMPNLFKDANLYAATRQGALIATADLTKITPKNVEPVGIDIAVDDVTGTFLISNDSEKRIYVVTLKKDDPVEGKIKATVLDQFSTSAYGSSDPEGLTIGGGKLYTADAAAAKVYVTGPGPNGVFDGVAPEGDDTTHGSFSTLPLGVQDAEGLEYDEITGTLYLVDRRTDIVAEATTSGTLIRTIKLRDFVPGVLSPADLTLAPSSNGSGRSLYIVERGVDNNDDPNENDGKIYEIALGNPPTPSWPVITGLEPANGPETGGTAVAISGVSFSPGATTVKFGSANAANVSCSSTTSCTATSPAGSGTVDVTVTVGGQTSAPNASSKFTYTAGQPTAPTVTGLNPAGGPEGGGTSVAISGTNFSPGATTVKFGSANAANVSCSSTTSCTATSPAGSGTVDVTVTVGGQTSAPNASSKFTYTAAPPPGGNLVLNPGFEDDVDNNTKPDMWSENSSKFTRSAGDAGVTPHGGSKYMGRFHATNNSGATITQNIPNITPGSTYSFSGYAHIPSQGDTSFSLKFQVRWLNSTGGTIQTTTVKTFSALTSTWELASATNLMAPSGTASAQIRMVASSLDGSFYVDNIVFQP